MVPSAPPKDVTNDPTSLVESDGISGPGGMAEPTGPNGETFREIYDAHFHWVWHALRRFSVPEKDVNDAVQNVFLVVHRKLPEFEGRSQLRTWITQIVRRVASDYRRSAPVRREIVASTTELDERPEKRSNAEDAAAHTQRVELARELLDQLPENQRVVFIMYELEQMSGQEIALELDVPLGTVRSRLRLARDSFQHLVQQFVGARNLEAG
jgi:RNA polymerase sigma-70 factor (ECF subfamily)